MKRRRVPKHKALIIFKSEICTIKSIYRKKLNDGNYIVFLHFNEDPETYVVYVNNLELLKGFKKGDMVTIHVGNGGYFCIEKGNVAPQDGQIRIFEI